jgi:hypothetical protein
VKKKAGAKAGTRAAVSRVAAQAKAGITRQAARAAELFAVIARRLKRIEEDFFDIGAALKELKEKKLFAAVGYRTFDQMLAERVPIGRSQAYKLIAIVERVGRDHAIELGEEKAYAIARLVAVTPEADTVASVLEDGVRVGTQRLPARTMSRRELDAARRTVAAEGKKVDPAERDAKREARTAQATLRKRGIGAKIELVKRDGRWWANVRVRVEELALLSGER